MSRGVRLWFLVWYVESMLKKKEAGLVPQERIENRIFLIRGKKVMLDRDLAELYGVETKVFNQAVKRNKKRFPDGFMFQLIKKEKDELVAICDYLNPLKFSSQLPYVFTEPGVAMLSSVLNSERAIQVNIQIIRIFIKLKEMILTHKDLKKKMKIWKENMKNMIASLKLFLKQSNIYWKKK